jgi:hypothetical protein
MAPLSKQDVNEYRTELMPVNPLTGRPVTDSSQSALKPIDLISSP